MSSALFTRFGKRKTRQLKLSKQVQNTTIVFYFEWVTHLSILSMPIAYVSVKYYGTCTLMA